MSDWIQFNAREEIKTILLRDLKYHLKGRNIDICKKCRFYVSDKERNGKTKEICRAMPTMYEAMAMLRLFNNGTPVPFEKRDVPMNCEFYAEQYMVHINKDDND